jgi:hypothetical protein
MTTNDIQRATIVASSPSSPARLHLAPVRAGQAVLDGGWWPRSWDPVAELPGLILALDARFGPIRQVLLNIDAWDCRFRRLAVGARVVRMGWFTSLDPALLIATTERGDQLDLLVVPPGTARAAARAAMARAADPADTTRAPAILATMPAALIVPPDDVTSASVWDNEGGHLAEARPPRPTGALSTPVRAEEPLVMSLLQTSIAIVIIAFGVAGLITAPRLESVLAR